MFKYIVHTYAVSNLDVLSDPYTIESEAILGYIVRACGNKNKENPNHAGQLWKGKINIAVPKQEDHEFWRELNLDSINGKGISENSTTLRIVAFGMSQQEARSFVMLKLINLIELVQEILHRRNEIDDMRSM